MLKVLKINDLYDYYKNANYQISDKKFRFPN